MGSGLFSIFTDLNEVCSTSDYSQFLDHYFMQTDACLWAFLIGLGITLVVIGIFYGLICNMSFKFSTRLNWVIALLITLAATFFASNSYLKGHDGEGADTSSGLYSDSYTYQDNYAEEIADNEDALIEWNQQADDFRQALATGEITITREIAVVNMCYSLVFFLLLSLGVKRFTTHGKNIPF